MGFHYRSYRAFFKIRIRCRFCNLLSLLNHLIITLKHLQLDFSLTFIHLSQLPSLSLFLSSSSCEFLWNPAFSDILHCLLHLYIHAGTFILQCLLDYNHQKSKMPVNMRKPPTILDIFGFSKHVPCLNVMLIISMQKINFC